VKVTDVALHTHPGDDGYSRKPEDSTQQREWVYKKSNTAHSTEEGVFNYFFAQKGYIQLKECLAVCHRLKVTCLQLMSELALSLTQA
jgi:hypothetical protein